MKKILIFIVGILGIFGTCFGSSICLNSFDLGNSSTSAGASKTTFILTGNLENFTFSSFSSSENTFFSDTTLYICYATGNITFSFFSASVSNYVSKGFSCDSYSYSLTNYGSTFVLDTPFVVPSSVTYLSFYLEFPKHRLVKTPQGSQNGDIIYLNDSFSLLNTWSSSLYLSEICYSEPVTVPKFKVNYGNTSYEYELTDNLTIKLNSPTILSGTDTYIYDGPTGINLFYNGLSQFYSKDKLYLKSMYWFNNNIFTPICL